MALETRPVERFDKNTKSINILRDSFASLVLLLQRFTFEVTHFVRSAPINSLIVIHCTQVR